MKSEKKIHCLPSPTLTDDFNVFILVLIIASAAVVVCVPPLRLHARSDFLGLGSDDAPPPPALVNTEIAAWVIIPSKKLSLIGISKFHSPISHPVCCLLRYQVHAARPELRRNVITN